MEEILVDNEIKFNEIKNTIKIWPYLDDVSAVIFPYTFRYLSNDFNMIVNLDFSNVCKVNSSIAAITLKKLVSLVISDKNQRHFKIKKPKNQYVYDFLQDSGFLNILDKYCRFNNYSGDLFDDKIQIKRNPSIVCGEFLDLKITSLPLYYLKYNESNERESVDVFSEWVDDNVLSLLDKYNVRTDLLFSVINEMAKNCQDHTKNDAFWGFDLIESKTGSGGELRFSCSDLGHGIAQTVRKYLENNYQEYLRSDVWRHGSLTDFYKWAFTVGNSTSSSQRNKGIGMTMIIDGAHELGLDLFFFDARSMMQIPDSLHHTAVAFNHEELRSKAWNTENKVGFYYYGRLKFK